MMPKFKGPVRLRVVGGWLLSIVVAPLMIGCAPDGGGRASGSAGKETTEAFAGNRASVRVVDEHGSAVPGFRLCWRKKGKFDWECRTTTGRGEVTGLPVDPDTTIVACGDGRLIDRLSVAERVRVSAGETVTVTLRDGNFMRLRFDTSIHKGEMQYQLVDNAGELIAFGLPASTHDELIVGLNAASRYTLLVGPGGDGRLGWLEGVAPGSTLVLVSLVNGLRSEVTFEVAEGESVRPSIVQAKSQGLIVKATEVLGNRAVFAGLPANTVWTVSASGAGPNGIVRGEVQLGAGASTKMEFGR